MSQLEETVQRMKSVAELLIPYTYPLAKFEDEQDVLCLKQSAVWLDGYYVVLSFSRARYEDYLLDTLQIQSATALFLPFNVVCKLGRAFLGCSNLAYVDFFRNNRKIYCWTVKMIEDRSVAYGNKTREANFEGFNFRVIEPGSINIELP